MNFFEELNPTGHLQIIKLFPNGVEEIILDEKNVIVSGFGVGLSYLFTLSGSNRITDYQLDRFQFGVCSTQTVANSVFKLDYPISSIAHYGADTKLVLVSSTQIRNGVNTANQVFGLIPFKNVTRVATNSVRYTITLDERTLNDIGNYGYPGGTDAALREIGLFMKNPRGDASPASILSAYKQFSPIKKSNEFSLVFRWTITL